MSTTDSLRRRRRWSITAVTAGAAVVLGSVGVASAVAAGSTASAADLTAMSASTIFAANPATVWSMSYDPQWICGLVPSCQSATRTVRSGHEVYTLTIGMGVQTVPGLTTVPVDIEVANRVPGQSMDLTVDVRNALGSFTSRSRLSVRPVAGQRARVLYETSTANGTGLTGRLVMGQMVESTRKQVSTAGTSYNQQAAQMPPIALRVSATRSLVEASRRAKRVRADISVTYPAGFATPTASGVMRVWAAGKLACVGKVTQSTGSCAVKTNWSKPVTLLTTVTGTLSTGVPFSLGTTSTIPAKAVVR